MSRDAAAARPRLRSPRSVAWGVVIAGMGILEFLLAALVGVALGVTIRSKALGK